MTQLEPWHLDRKVPIALIVAIALQTFGVVWWAATVTETVNQLAEKLEFNTSGDRRQWDAVNSNSEKIQELFRSMAKQEGILEHIVRQNQRILERIDKHQSSPNHGK